MNTVEERFWAKVVKDNDCWGWTAKLDKDGYGRFSPNGGNSQMPAHRFSWEIHFGPIPDNLFVCHHCDTPACTNPDHLFLGTAQENMEDKVRKGRWRGCAPERMSEIVRGRPPRVMSKLEPQLDAITARRNNGESLQEIATSFECDKAVIRRLLVKHGLYTPQKTGPRGPHNVRTAVIRANLDAILERLRGGESSASVAKSLGTSSGLITRITSPFL